MASLLSTAISIFSIVCMWMVFEKAGEAGWQALIPIWNAWILAKIANRKWTFWVQQIAGILLSIFFIIAIISMVNLSMSTPEYYGDHEYNDEYYYDYEEDYVSFIDETPAITNLSTVASVEDELTDEEMAMIEDSVDALLEESSGALIALIVVIVLPFLFILPLMIVNLCQYIGLSEAFGLHWAFALVLLFFNPVGLGILAFAKEIQYVGADGSNPAPAVATAAAGFSSASAYHPAEQPLNNDYHSADYQSTDCNPYTPVSQANIAPDVSELPHQEEPAIPQVKHRCPSCGYESDKVPNPDTFCPNCGHLYRS